MGGRGHTFGGGLQGAEAFLSRSGKDLVSQAEELAAGSAAAHRGRCVSPTMSPRHGGSPEASEALPGVPTATSG